MSFLSQPLTLFTIPPVRSFGGISGYVTLQENTTDTLTITKQPVQQGSTISDNAFKNPVSFAIQMLFSPGTASFNAGQSLSQIYQNLLALQNSLTPFTCTTPKRVYQNMLFTSLGLTTDKKTENALAITASFEQIIIVNIGVTQLTTAQLKNAQKNAATQNAGKKSGILTIVNAVIPPGAQ